MHRRAKKSFRLIQTSILCLSITASSSGCALKYITEKLDITKKFQESKANVLSTGELSSETVQELRVLSLNKPFEKDPEATLATMESTPIPGRLTEQAQALAEAAFLHAGDLYKSGKKLEAAKYYLMAAANAYDFLFHSKDVLAHTFVSPFGRNMTELYNASISKILDIHQSEKTNWTLPWKTTVGNTVYNITKSADPKKQIALVSTDEFLPAYEIQVKGLNNFYKTQGIGAPIVRKQQNIPETPEFNRFFPKVLSSPVTILLDFSERKVGSGNAERDVVVSFINPYKESTTQIEGIEYPIEADYSTSFGVMLSDLQPGALDIDQLLNPEKYITKIGLKFIQPYDPEKIPVVLVHGLASSPATFIQMANDLMGVDTIRKHYQFWVFGYPTGLPILDSSTRLRAALLDAAKEVNPEGNNPNFNKMVIVGHSMGGILSRSMVLEGSQHLYEAFVSVPIEQLDLTDSERTKFKETFFFNPVPSVSRAVLIASPLRGSEIAQGSFVSKISRWFISLPRTLISFRQSVLSKNRQYLNPKLNNSDFVDVPVNSVSNLRPDSPLLKAYIETPTVANLPYHTIIGIQDATQGPGSDDGIVPYESAHLDGAQSELLVHDGHSCLDNAQTIVEVRRILLLHLEQLHIQ